MAQVNNSSKFDFETGVATNRLKSEASKGGAASIKLVKPLQDAMEAPICLIKVLLERVVPDSFFAWHVAHANSVPVLDRSKISRSRLD